MVIGGCSQKSRLKHFAVTDAVIGAFYDVYNELGHGFLESVYREAMIVALRTKDVPVEREKPVDVEFRGEIVGVFRTDLLVENCVVVELKCARTIDSNHEAQLLNYLKATGFEVGLLLNFGVKPQFRRMILETARDRHLGVLKGSAAKEADTYGAHPAGSSRAKE
jgi:GxxExxY protein